MRDIPGWQCISGTWLLSCCGVRLGILRGGWTRASEAGPPLALGKLADWCGLPLRVLCSFAALEELGEGRLFLFVRRNCCPAV